MCRLHALCIAAAALAMQACAPLSMQSRAAHSSLGCMHAALAHHPLAMHSALEAHCIAAGLIARHCSVTEAHLASYGKELVDLFGHGDASLEDLAADRRGVRCARSATSDAALIECCRLAD